MTPATLSSDGRLSSAEARIVAELVAIRTALEALVKAQEPRVAHTYTAPLAVTDVAPSARPGRKDRR